MSSVRGVVLGMIERAEDQGYRIVDKGGGIMLSQEPKAMGNALVSFLQNRREMNQIGKRARLLAVEDFDFEVCAQRLIRIYEGI